MLERFGFVCACERCIEEEGEERNQGSGKEPQLLQQLVPRVPQGAAAPTTTPSEHDQGKLDTGLPIGASLAQALHRASADAAVRSPGINLTPNMTPNPGINMTPNAAASTPTPAVKTALVGASTAPHGTAAPTPTATAHIATATAIATSNHIGSRMTSVLHARAVLLAIGCIAMAVILARARAARAA
jgi:hypothetical protein